MVADIAATAEAAPRAVPLYFRSKQDRFEHRVFGANRELRACRMTATLDAAVQAFAEELGAASDDIGPRIATALALLEAGCQLSKARDVMPGEHRRGARRTGCPALRLLRHSCPPVDGHGIRDRSRREMSSVRAYRGGDQVVQSGERVVRPVLAVHDVDERHGCPLRRLFVDLVDQLRVDVVPQIQIGKRLVCRAPVLQYSRMIASSRS
ncbi:hypothetical protein [Streptomyces hyaluromycini]|uniref:hypothetical protein n=1 Tax=Streptomyces hyaluromycini TaxID=1377993 RepID=UPI0011AE97CB|nr:hypothetical protein [Streptomyces hyaluromycini]